MKKIVAFILILFLAACGSGEKKAQGVAEDYMDSVKKGEEFKAILSDTRFTNLFNYDHLKTTSEEEIKDALEFSKVLWDLDNEGYESWEKYKEAMIQEYDDYEIVEETDDYFKLWNGESTYNEYTFLYDVETTNDEGQKIYKKADITVRYNPESTVEELQDGYILNIDLR